MQPTRAERIAVIGAGLMGHGIAQEFAAAGKVVTLHDLSPDLLRHVRAGIRENLEALGRTGDVAATLARIRFTVDLADAVGDADVVIEAVTENLELKQRLFRDLDRLCPPHTVLASNTSSFLPSQLAELTNRPDRVAVAHYFNPPYLLPLVEIVRGEATAEATVATLRELLLGIGKSPVVVQRELPGFIGNRLQIALLREALALVERGVASPEDVDTVIKNGFGRRLAVAGIFEVFDIAGWDTVLAASEEIQPTLEARPDPSPLLRDKVARGELGLKRGRGFYHWTPESADALRERIRRALLMLGRPDPDAR